VDNGITANEEIAYAVEKGIDVVVTDHHKPQGELPGAVAVVDPHRSDCPSGCTGYAGVGVAFMLVCALEGDVDSVMNAYGDLVAIGTLADVMPLTGNVRTLVRMGLDVLNRKERKGILELCKVAGLADKPITASRTVFGLAPRLNAAGRMADPVLALELLLSDGEESQKLAHSLQDLNTTRQNVEQNILKEIFEQIEQNPCLVANRVIVVSGKDWPMGVVGILASRLTDRYGKPAIVISQTDGVAKGSGRSISGFSLFDALQACEKELLTFGGHELAAGLTVDPDKINDFRTAINTYAKEKYEEMPVPELRIEFKINPATIDAQKAVVLSALEPTGMGNPAPVFGLFNVRLDNITPLSGNQHRRLSFTKDNHRFEVMHFFTNCKHYPLLCGETYHLAVSVEATNFNNIIKPTVILKDVRYADTDEEALITSHRLFDRIMCKEDWKEVLPTREQMKLVYGFLHSKEEVQMTLEQLHHCFKHSDFSLIVLRTMLEIWKQAGLIKLEEQGEVLHIECIKTQQKADLTRTPLWEYLDRKE
jgi:single-stranded-DNA-specific exonuclease